MCLSDAGFGVQPLGTHAGHHRAAGDHDRVCLLQAGWLHKATGPAEHSRPVQHLSLGLPLPHLHHRWRAGAQPHSSQQVSAVPGILLLTALQSDEQRALMLSGAQNDIIVVYASTCVTATNHEVRGEQQPGAMSVDCTDKVEV